MEWNRSETLALASAKCATCEGSGFREKTKGDEAVCNCVLRAIFRACYDRFVQCANKDLTSSRISLEHATTRDLSGGWSRRNEEYVADFLQVAKKNLTEEEHKLFRFHFLLGADWRLCCRKLDMEKGNFFHAVYRIQHKLGRVFRNLQPYALYPVRDYFTSGRRDKQFANVVSIRPERTTNLPNLISLKRAA